MDKYIWINNKRYYYYETYDTWQKANAEAKWQKKKNKSQYFILKTETGIFDPEMKYRLYLTKVIRLF